MTKKITEFLLDKPSFLKWGNKRLAQKFGCSERTISAIKNNLKDVKREYVASFGY